MQKKNPTSKKSVLRQIKTKGNWDSDSFKKNTKGKCLLGNAIYLGGKPSKQWPGEWDRRWNWCGYVLGVGSYSVNQQHTL